MRVLVFLALLPLAGCVVPTVVPDLVYSPCRALGSAEWKARVEKLPVTRHHPPLRKWRLIVDGQVTVPSDGYSVSLERGPVEKLRDPVQQIMIRTEGAGEGDPRTMAVHGEFEALKRYGAVAIRCGDGTVGLIRDVPRIPS